MSFSNAFVWGAASASYQVEGAPCEDGKGLSVWDMFCKKPDSVWKKQNGDVACDHYHRWREDVALMKEMGVKAYRFSISWPRVLPNGTGMPNAKGLDFYSRLVDGLMDAGITPYATLFHWDYPYELYCNGGWLNADSSNWFAEYTAVVARKLSDRVTNWMTLNEPLCFIGVGLQEGRHAPGDKLGRAQVLRAGHNALLAHGKAVQALRATSVTPCRIGYATAACVKTPVRETPADIEAARTAMWRMTDDSVWNNTWWMDPVYLGAYPQDGLAIYGADAPAIGPDDMRIISQPLDFCGVNIYTAEYWQADAGGNPELIPISDSHPLTAIRWPITPEGLYWGPRFYHERYKLPILITENGMSNNDIVALDGRVHDPQRIDFLHRHLRQLRRAAEEGVPVEGYLHWSLTDNFEWANGYKERFGLIYVDYQTQQRVIKDSGYWYKDVIATNGAKLHHGMAADYAD